MDGDTAKNLISRIRNSDMDEEAQNEAIQKVKEERSDSRPAAVVGVSTTEDGMNGNVRLSMGERTPTTLAFEEDAGDEDEGTVRREEMVAAAAPEAKRTVNALCDLRQMHLGDFSGDHARGGR